MDMASPGPGSASCTRLWRGMVLARVNVQDAFFHAIRRQPLNAGYNRFCSSFVGINQPYECIQLACTTVDKQRISYDHHLVIALPANGGRHVDDSSCGLVANQHDFSLTLAHFLQQDAFKEPEISS